MFTGWDAFLYALLGGAIGQGLLIAEEWKSSGYFPTNVRSVGYWVSTLLLILVGGAVAVIYANQGSVELNSVLAANIGLSPAIAVDRYLKGAKSGDPGSVS